MNKLRFYQFYPLQKDISLPLRIILGLSLYFLGLLSLYSESNPELDNLPKRIGIQRVFGEKGNIREKPDIKSKLQNQIPVGSSLKVLKRTEEYMTFDGITDYWYQIQNASKTGYMWGGFLADFIYEQDFTGDGDKEIFLLKNSTKNKEQLQIKIVKSYKVLGEFEKKSGPISNFSVKVLSGNVFDPDLSLFALFYSDDSDTDPYPKVDIYYFDKENKIKLGFEFIEKGCDPPACSEVTPIFPNDIPRGKRPGGETNKIILHVHTYDLDNESKHEYSQIEYLWNGEQFNKVK